MEIETLNPAGAEASLIKLELKVGGEADLFGRAKPELPDGTAMLRDRSRV